MLKYIANQDVIFHNNKSININIGSKEEKSIRALWRAVITQALMDASNLSKKPFNRMEKIKARIWLEGKSEEFFAVCSLADMDPNYVKTKAAEAIARNCKWRNDSGSVEANNVKKHNKDIYLYDNIYYGK